MRSISSLTAFGVAIILAGRGAHADTVTFQSIPNAGSANDMSPDGRYIAALPSDEHELLLLDLKTKKWQELAKGEIAYPCWSRDGEYDLIYSDCDQGGDYGR